MLPLPFVDAGLGVAAVRSACGSACVTSLLLPQTEMRLKERGHPPRQRRPTSGRGREHTPTPEERTREQRYRKPAGAVQEGSDLAARRDVLDPQRRKDSPASSKEGPGSHQVTERDRDLLGFIGEQYAVTLDQLAVLIGRSYRTARGLRDRWCTAGWTSSSRLSVDLPPFVWLTSKGSSVAGSRFRTWQPNHGLVRHIEAVTNVRLLLEHQLHLGQWRCERSLAKGFVSRSDWGAHLPDGVLLTPERTAIEVELTRKSRKRLDQIVLDVGIAYDQVWYFAGPRLLPVLRERAASAPYSNVTVYCYPPRAADLAGIARTS